ncbi:DUF3237 domain-containing protein [Streptomyces ziwulingensis]|uniref:Uncharacterized protein n=1 Tax=Streptomyces ziwulingensis TaxID=1045501 RepID=A0ABP9BR33_9ACTN
MPPLTPAAPALTFFAHLSVRVDAPYDLGEAPDGHRRLVPLTGGSFDGPEVRGTVLAAGADNQVLRTATLTELDARYVLAGPRPGAVSPSARPASSPWPPGPPGRCR